MQNSLCGHSPGPVLYHHTQNRSLQAEAEAV